MAARMGQAPTPRPRLVQGLVFAMAMLFAILAGMGHGFAQPAASDRKSVV